MQTAGAAKECRMEEKSTMRQGLHIYLERLIELAACKVFVFIRPSATARLTLSSGKKRCTYYTLHIESPNAIANRHRVYIVVESALGNASEWS
jgi:hypothetical protein